MDDNTLNCFLIFGLAVSRKWLYSVQKEKFADVPYRFHLTNNNAKFHTGNGMEGIGERNSVKIIQNFSWEFKNAFMVSFEVCFRWRTFFFTMFERCFYRYCNSEEAIFGKLFSAAIPLRRSYKMEFLIT